MWCYIWVESEIPWPREPAQATFRSHEITVFPGDRAQEHRGEPFVELKLASSSPSACETGLVVLKRFLSSLSWAYGGAIRECHRTSRGARWHLAKVPCEREPVARFRGSGYLAEPLDKRALLALAIYREALGIEESPRYRYLGFYEIIDIIRRSPKSQKKWIRAALPRVQIPSARKRLERLTQRGVDVAEHLYDGRRCPVAHARDLDPDEVTDRKAIYADMSLIRNLAEIALRDDLRLPQIDPPYDYEW